MHFRHARFRALCRRTSHRSVGMRFRADFRCHSALGSSVAGSTAIVCPWTPEDLESRERVLREVVEAYRHQRNGLHRYCDAACVAHRLMVEAVPGIQPVRCADHRAADRHDRAVSDSSMVCRPIRRTQGRCEGCRRSDLQQAATVGHHSAWLQAQPDRAVHARYQMSADRRCSGGAYHRRMLWHRPQAGRRSAAGDSCGGRHRHLRRCGRHGSVRLHQGAAGAGGRQDEQ